MTDTQQLIGKAIPADTPRDAIHVAVAPVTADTVMYAAQLIRLVEGSSTKVEPAASHREAHGIVDPFLPKGVRKGSTFFMFLMPGTTTSLRHSWSHPAFTDENVSAALVGAVSAAVSHRGPSEVDRRSSEEWLRHFCETHDCPDYDQMLVLLGGGSTEETEEESFISGRMDGEYFTIYGQDAGGTIPPEFWHHARVVTGRPFVDPPTYFSCSC